MKNETKQLYNAYVARIAHLNGVTADDVKEGFSVQAAPEQKLKEKVLQNSQFLQWINTPTVTNMKGEMIGLGVAQTIASTTDTNAQDRQTKDLLNLDKRTYNCEQVNFDSHIRWARLDEWAKHPDFQEKVASQTQKTIALNLIMMGWNGTSRAATSNPSSNTLLQDVKKGWLQQLREDTGGTKVMSGADTENKIKVGKGQGTGENAGKGYENLDALVTDAVNNLIHEVYAEDTDLVVICGREVLHDKYFTMINQDLKPTDQLASQVIVSQKQIGGLKAIRVPFFPKNAMLITRLDNLSIYMQEGTTRRFIQNNPKRDRIEDYLSQNIDYKIEDYECAALIENIVLEDVK
ncbi:phage major capsid protein, P2 family [Glaesserella parasuis]|uniref:Phage major capsid protein, P2 family n=1 Tax=Glaesserella parasuis TaxID=738 RepID=A0AA42JFZ6_GLAPU|nr:phage major capsid protein, P2 family [Glaesserella parasuis]EQA03718.1 phage major capsid protein, P2 family [Glaesserella parasuis SW114]KEZ23048.1 phage major capsid protein, P2 family [Glaesserella parasuis]MCT8579884.1 phage major capsid protein, P2 family [Glaesserella parasuis]MCT8593949.1 phage major capsid protein, P2 family [Glaesserella parasuis]MCT8716113.1 phage major capsid protein, P2 family [Glaesserella parasuis]